MTRKYTRQDHSQDDTPDLDDEYGDPIPHPSDCDERTLTNTEMENAERATGQREPE